MMNTTTTTPTTLELLIRARNPEQGTRVPDIFEFSGKYTPLFLKLGTAKFIKSFAARNQKQGIELSIVIRPEHHASVVAIARLKSFFNGLTRVTFPTNFEGSELLIKVV